MSRLNFPIIALAGLLATAGCTGEAAAPPADHAPQAVSLSDLMSEIDSREGEIVVVNFWATWCVPCRVEFPELVRFGQDFEEDGIDVVFVSVDFDSDVEAATEFLTDQEVPWTSFIKSGVDSEFIDAFHTEWSGALPATFVYDRKGNLRAFWEGMTTYEELSETVERIL